MDIDVDGNITNLTEAECRGILRNTRPVRRAVSEQWFTARGLPPGIGDNHWLKNYAEQHVLNAKLADAVFAYIRVNGVPSNSNPVVE